MPKGIPGSTPPCSKDGCDETRGHAKGLCANHYAQAYGKRLREKKRVARQRPCVICGKVFDGIRGAVTCSLACHRQQPEVRERIRANDRRWYASLPPEATRRRRNLPKYGLTEAEYDKLLIDQGGRCAICGQEPRGGRTASARLHVDHCHDTGTVRALLCTRCNQGLGYFKDDPALLRAAADYIDRHREVALSAPPSTLTPSPLP